jgi:hypothetical protein
LKRIAENFRSLASRHRHCHAPFVLCVKPDRLLAARSTLNEKLLILLLLGVQNAVFAGLF